MTRCEPEWPSEPSRQLTIAGRAHCAAAGSHHAAPRTDILMDMYIPKLAQKYGDTAVKSAFRYSQSKALFLSPTRTRNHVAVTNHGISPKVVRLLCH